MIRHFSDELYFLQPLHKAWQKTLVNKAGRRCQTSNLHQIYFDLIRSHRVAVTCHTESSLSRVAFSYNSNHPCTAFVLTMISPNLLPSLSQILDQTQEVFGMRPCLWQIKVVEAILKCNGDVVSIAGTGMGKTLTFWMPLLFWPPGSIQIVVTPLNILGKQIYH